MLVLGVDGCPAGWLAVAGSSPNGCKRDAGLSLSWAVHENVSAVLASPEGAAADSIVIDVPIGLSDGPPRPCDREARLRLGPRRFSVFSPPMRAMLDMPDRAAASTLGQTVRPGGGLSAQSWNILPKIREVDAALTPAMQDWVREGHPELAFARLADCPMAHAKKTRLGQAERIVALKTNGIDPEPLLREVEKARPRQASVDDVLDACVLVLTARDAIAGRAWVLGGQRDARGLAMEILG